MDKGQLKNYYSKYFANNSVKNAAEALKCEIENWKKYRNKILNKGGLTAAEFNGDLNSFAKESSELPYSLRNFAENHSKTVGSLGSMVSGDFPLRVTGGKTIFHNAIVDRNEDAIMKKVNSYLKELLSKESLEDVSAFLANDSMTKLFRDSFLFKLIVFNSLTSEIDIDYRFKLLGIYKYDGIQQLEVFSALSEINEGNPAAIVLKKSQKAVELFNEAVGADNKIKDAESFCRAQRCVWELGNTNYQEIESTVTPNIIFYGAPGTGKTYAVTKALDALPNVETKFVQFHPSFTYEDFIEGIKPVGTDENGNLKFDVVNGVFKDFCIAAKNDPEKQYYFVADEINRANLSAVFGETLSLLEPDYRFDPGEDVSKQQSCLRATPLSKVIQAKINAEKIENKKKETREKLAFETNESGEVLFGIPKNVHFIGMMNDVDKSIDTFDLALRRRFLWIRKDFDPEALHEILLSNNNLNGEEANKYIDSCQKLNNYISGCNSGKGETLGLGKAYEFGHAFFKDIKVGKTGHINIQAKNDLFDNHLAPTLREYCRSFLSETELDKSVAKAKEFFCKNDTENTADAKKDEKE